MRFALGLVLAASVLAGCEADGQATEIMLLVNTNLEPSGGLHRIRIRVLRADPDGPSGMPDTPVPPSLDAVAGDRVVVDGEPYEHRWVREVAVDETTRGLLPLTLGLVPEAGDGETRPYYFEAFALDAGGEILTSVAARAAFVPHQRVRVYLWLTDACVGKRCPPGRTCWFGECIDEERPGCHVPAGEDAGLGASLRCDAGSGPALVDAGMDAGSDGGVDGGFDGGEDAGPSCECSGSRVDDCGNCRVRRCDGCRYGACEDNAGSACSAGDSCMGCRTSGDYSGWRSCVSGSWASQCCVLADAACGSTADCCNDATLTLVCQSGRCCMPSGESCSLSVHCCSLDCAAGTCT